MTPTEIDALEAGHELDDLVSQAIDPWENLAGVNLSTQWRPSTDWNDAMFAAEKCRLFVNDRFLDNDVTGHWMVQVVDWCDAEAAWISRHPSGPVAICRAILKVKQ